MSCLFISALSVKAQDLTSVPLDTTHWKIQGHFATENFQGKQCLKITDGAAYLKDTFENGIVEFDISFDKDRCFPGLMFRIKDQQNFEFLYFRPHQSGNPDAIQYCPIFDGDDTWQLFTGQGYTAAFDYPPNSWIHVKVIITGKKAALYLNDQAKPILYMYELQRPVSSGDLALDNHSPTAVRFASFSYAKLDHPVIENAQEPVLSVPGGIIKRWEISQAFSEKDLDDRLYLDDNMISNSAWKSAEAGTLGFVNIGQFVPKTNERNMVLTKFTVGSDRQQIKKLAIGFSDRCKVYLNNKLLYAGSNTFKSRDYRFYGTIGFWDEVFLDLKPGDNEVIIAVAEDFGGWGVEARFADNNGITVKYR